MTAAAALVGVSCADATSTGGAGHATAQQAVTVMPEFSIQGTEGLPEQFQLTDLGLVISEIRLEPVADDANGIAYSNRDPIEMAFDVHGGERTREGESFVLPEAGKYNVSLRLEPVRYQYGQPGSGSYSFSLSGYIRGDAVLRVDTHSDGEDFGNPVPLPFEPKKVDSEDGKLHDRSAVPKQWTRFQYQSRKSLVYTLDEVEFGAGRQYLSFVFEVEDWAQELIKPISKVVRDKSRDVPDSVASSRPVDVTKAIDSLGEGPAALGDHMKVRATRLGSRGRSGL